MGVVTAGVATSAAPFATWVPAFAGTTGAELQIIGRGSRFPVPDRDALDWRHAIR